MPVLIRLRPVHRDETPRAPVYSDRGGFARAGGYARKTVFFRTLSRILLFPLVFATLFAQESYDLLLSGGRIVDGAGNPWFRGDVAIRQDRIVRIAPAGVLSAAPARERIDCSRMVVAPGFIDIQGQSGGAFLTGDGRAVSHITQGITTEILGEGYTPAPQNDKTLAALAGTGRPQYMLQQFTGRHGFRAWLEAMRARGTAPNVGSFLGAATVRSYVKGEAQGPPTLEEIGQMQTVVREAMEDGAFGIASALIYPPGSFATTAELGEMAKAMAPYGGVYITHMRSEADHLLEAIEEAIEIGRRGGVPVEIYHLKAAGVANWPKMPEAIARIDAARRDGIDIGADMYAYTAGATGLTACLPPWTAADGKLFDNLADPEIRAKIRDEMLIDSTDWENLCRQATPQGVLITALSQPANQQFAGKRLSEIANSMHKSWMDAAMDLILSEHRRVETIYFIASEENIELELRQPWIKIGTDSSGVDPDTAKQLVHPRAYGNYPRILGRYVRERRVIPLEDAIRKMTLAVANRLSIPDRGALKEGMFADIVVFNPDTVIDRATYENPHQLPVGVRDVFVNGVAVVRDAKPTGALPGRIVSGPGYTP